jgi:hypothetical protein
VFPGRAYLKYATIVTGIFTALAACSSRRAGLDAYPIICSSTAAARDGCVRESVFTWDPSNVPVQYPQLLADAGVNGYVLGDLLINTDGRVDSLHLRRLTNQRFLESLLGAVRSWRVVLYRPTKVGRPLLRVPIEARFMIQCPAPAPTKLIISQGNDGWRIDVIACGEARRRSIWPIGSRRGHRLASSP